MNRQEAATEGFSPALALMVGLLFWATATQLHSALAWGHESWQLGDWLINYAGGFVRRGLTGTLVQLVSNATGLQANHVVIVASLACYVLLALWLLRRRGTFFPASLVLSCVIMGFPGYQDCIIRKDCLLLLLFLGCIKAADSGLSPAVRILLVNVLAGVAILTHEAFAFFALPALAVIVGRNPPAGAVLRELALLPAAVCLILAITFHGTPAIAEAVNDSWLPLWRITDPGNTDVELATNAIMALGWSSEKGLSLSSYMLTSGFYQPTAWAIVYSISIVLVLLFTGRDQIGRTAMEVKIKVAAILLAQLVFISPLFLLGVDYGRWLFFWMTSSMILHITGRRAPQWIESLVRKIFETQGISWFFQHVRAKDWYLLLFGVPVCWNIFNFLTASPLGRHVEMLWSKF